jgi:hypothetical protein
MPTEPDLRIRRVTRGVLTVLTVLVAWTVGATIVGVLRGVADAGAGPDAPGADHAPPSE